MPVTLPTAQDVRKARKQATTVVAGALEQARTPLYAALGAGNLATETVVSYAKKARGEAAARAGQAENAQARTQARIQAGATDLQAKLTELQAHVGHAPDRLRSRLDEVSNELLRLRGRLEPEQVREFADSYRRMMQELYDRLAVRGERVYGDLVAQPRVRQAVGRVEHAADTAEVRVEKFVEEARAIADEVLGRASRRTRSVGEKAAYTTQKAASQASEAVAEAGDEVASTTRSVTRKAANRTQPATTVSSAKTNTKSSAATTANKTADKQTANKQTGKSTARVSKPAARRTNGASGTTRKA